MIIRGKKIIMKIDYSTSQWKQKGELFNKTINCSKAKGVNQRTNRVQMPAVEYVFVTLKMISVTS